MNYKSNSRSNKKGEQIYIYEIEFIINLPTKRTPGENLASEFFHTFKEKKTINPICNLPSNEERRELPLTFYELILL